MMMTRASMGAMEGPLLDDVIRRLLGGGGRQVKLFEAEIRQLCIEAKKVFLSQPNLLELHAPIKICGKFGSSSSLFNLMWCSCLLREPGSSVLLGNLLKNQKKKKKINCQTLGTLCWIARLLDMVNIRAGNAHLSTRNLSNLGIAGLQLCTFSYSPTRIGIEDGFLGRFSCIVIEIVKNDVSCRFDCAVMKDGASGRCDHVGVQG
ncbi:hypothetical protein BHE74_00011169 [Ensete ventricosum]|nr:hypothetical protein BHE74_00011169 [Ensete ventricosum]